MTLFSKIAGLTYSSDFTAELQRPEISEPLLRLIPNEGSIQDKTGLSLTTEEHLSSKIISGKCVTDISAATITISGWFKPAILPSTLFTGSVSVEISAQGRISLLYWDNYDPRTILTAAHLYTTRNWLYVTLQRSPSRLDFFVGGVLQGFTSNPPQISIKGIGSESMKLDDIVVVPKILWSKSFTPPATYL